MPDFLGKFNAIKASVKEQLNGQGGGFPGTQRLESGPSQNSSPSSPYWTANFTGEHPVSQEWRHETGAHGWGNAELEDYTASDRNSFFRGSALVLKAIAAGDSLTSARLTSYVTLGRDRGYLAARITAPSARGVWPAFWLLPSEPFSWPTDGEMDIMESWNGEKANHSCLHWGHYNGEDHDKHRVVDTANFSVDLPQGHSYGLAWDQGRGRLLWYIDGRAVMKADIPQGIRKMGDFQVKLNIAMGGNVMQGARPADGEYEMVVHDMGLFESPPGSWEGFERSWVSAPVGHGY